MIEVREAGTAEANSYARRREDRLRSWFGRFGTSVDWVDHHVRGNLSDLARGTSTTYAILDDDATVGSVTIAREQFRRKVATITDLFVVPEHRRCGVATAVLAWAREQVVGSVDVLGVDIDPADEASSALFGAWPTRSQTMIKRVVDPGPLPAGVGGREMTDAEFTAWYRLSVRGYAADRADSGSTPPHEALAVAEREFAKLLPAGLHTKGHTLWVVSAGSRSVATNWIQHHSHPGSSWVYAVETHEDHRGHGYGRAAMILGERATLGAGDTHLGLNVFGHNAAAIGLYTAMGYAPVERHRSVEL